ncbi:MAG TPA: asparagine synthase (glutamine-hydrolyzing) [Candidatus Saccharimonadales bacterium]|nr:asparagine synthase (glutamine-hydrolyzing) [Candidatus Saccharimonadales bacterium]
MEMTHAVAYRGPNGFGFAYASQNCTETPEIIHNENKFPGMQRPVVGFGSRRLAILDTSSAGNMPMISDDGHYCIVFNGEIYNYKEIRQELQQRGHRFRTGTDTEVILHSYQEWGEECLKRFNGMWGFALWDQSKQILFCARDRFGVKPFYYASHNGSFYFGSEIKQILIASSMSREANSGAVSNFLEWGLVDNSSETFFKNVFQLPGGCWLKLDVTSPLCPRIGRFWDLRIEPMPERPVADTIEEFRHKFETSVKLRLRSDVPVGVSLSGGLDSSSVLCQAKQIAPEIELQSFSACFDEQALDERSYVSTVLSSTGGIGHEVFPQAGPFWKTIETMIYHHDEPILGTSAFAQWSVMKEARRCGVPVMLGGQGADESLCGYQKYFYFYLMQLVRETDKRFFREAASWIFGGSNFYWTADSVARYIPGLIRSPLSLTGRVGTVEFHKDYKDSNADLGAMNGVAARQKTDLIRTSIPALLHHEDRNSMAHSVETRLPFLDYELVEFAVNCPTSLKLQGGWSKWMLRTALKGTLPETIRLRKTKLGFDAPDSAWVRAGLRNGHSELCDTPKLRMNRFMDEVRFARECKNFVHRFPAALPSAAIFRAISLELWARAYSVS